MTKTSRDIFTCSICKKEYERESDHDKCVIGHDIAYIGLERRFWKKLQLILEQAYMLGVDIDHEVYEGIKNLKEQMR